MTSPAKILLLLCALSFSLYPRHSLAASFEQGVTAYKNKDYTKAVSIWRYLAQKGDPRSQQKLGLSYKRGHGVPTHYKTAIKWFKRSASQGFAEGQYSLGYMNYFALGTKRNLIRAYMWSNLAASSGQKKHAKLRDFIQQKLKPADIEKAQDLSIECLEKRYQNC